MDSDDGRGVLEKRRGTATPSSIAIVTAGVESAICVLFIGPGRSAVIGHPWFDSCLLIRVDQRRKVQHS